MRRTIAVLAALLLATVIAVPVEAATIHRTFRASLGADGASGTTSIDAYTDGSGRVAYDLRALKKSATYRVEVHKGRCGNLGKTVTRLADVQTTSSGTFSSSRALTITKMNRIWEANWYNRLAIKFISGGSTRCGNLNFTSASRIRMPKQDVLNAGIDLAVVRSPKGYPYCNVGMYMGALSQPTEPGTTYLFAHARKGMFLPLLNQWEKNRGVDMIGLEVYVYTSNNLMHTYVIEKVWKSKTLDGVYKDTEKLWLQTSTGPNYTYPKLFLQARRESTISVSWSEAHPKADIVKCG